MTDSDYGLWAKRPFWNLQQTTHLLLGLDPESAVTPLPSDMQERFSRMQEVIEASVGHGLTRFDFTLPTTKDDGHKFIPFDVISWTRVKKITCPSNLDAAVMDMNLSKLHAGIVEERVAELKQAIKLLADQTVELRKNNQELALQLERLRAMGVGSTNATTHEFIALQKAQAKFWADRNSSAPPKKSVVTAWLRAEGISARLANAIDTILRPKSARRGGNKRYKSS